ncbi:LVIVD repeat-containing protein [Maribacter sp. 2307ULW6-5]|uniref:LVIVD repeat-containing protein n=1 Tax=Maribacter sp. 2307ULW6-5 TaxID=3386275 RepID=UPI0039BD4132
MKKQPYLLLFALFLAFSACDDQEDIRDVMVATPIVMNAAEFKADAISIMEPQAIVSSGKIYAYRHYIFVNDVNQGIHVLDNRDPYQPKKVAYIKVAGNNDVSIKDNRLYADSYGDLVIFDITNVEDIKLVKRMENAIYESSQIWMSGMEMPRADFYDYEGFDPEEDVIVGWEVQRQKRHVNDLGWGTMENFDAVTNGLSNAAPSRGQGQGGSMARFKIVGNHLYVVDRSNLNVMDISDLEAPQVLKDVFVGWDIETIFNQGNILFLGGRQGMYIYDATNAAKPTFLSEFRHGRACDPVVVDGNFAYVTLKGGNGCGDAQSGLYIVDVSDLKNPELKVMYPMDGPNGLGIWEDTLFICDGDSGLKVYDKSDAPNITLVNHFEDIVTYDVIPLPTSLLLIGDQTLRQYEYLENDIVPISVFSLQ